MCAGFREPAASCALTGTPLGCYEPGGGSGGLDRKQERVIPALGIDEKAFKKGHKYMTVVCDLERATVEHVAEDRKAEGLQAFWNSLSPEQLNGVEVGVHGYVGPLTFRQPCTVCLTPIKKSSLIAFIS